MIQKFFRNIARKRTESELDNLISRFSSSDVEEILILSMRKNRSTISEITTD
jgi:hypothetical protein